MARTLAEELGRLRVVKNVSLRQVEEVIGISNAYLSQLERGDAAKPSPHWLHKLSQYYGVPYESLMALAGYLDATAARGTTQRPPSSLELLLMSANLSDDEQAEVAHYVEYLTSKRGKS